MAAGSKELAFPQHSRRPDTASLSGRSDPVLAYATELMGSAITVENAGQLNFLIPKTEDYPIKTTDKLDQQIPGRD